MKILLMGEYSNVHATLAEGLRQLGHEVTVLSNGDFWKNYPRDIDLVRKPGKWGGIAYMARLYALLPKLRGYDVVQLINPMFLELKAERILPVYRYQLVSRDIDHNIFLMVPDIVLLSPSAPFHIHQHPVTLSFGKSSPVQLFLEHAVERIFRLY